MFFKIPSNTDKIKWTNHVIGKMRFYGLSSQKIKNVLAMPKRKEIGIVENTIAVMRTAGSKKNPSEIWVMYQQVEKGKLKKIESSKIIIISAWRYPGVSPIRGVIPIPLEIEKEIYDVLKEFSAEG